MLLIQRTDAELFQLSVLQKAQAKLFWSNLTPLALKLYVIGSLFKSNFQANTWYLDGAPDFMYYR